MDGKDVKTIIKDVKYLPHPFGIAVHDQYVYWTNWEYKSLLRTNKYDGSYVETVQRDLTSPMDIKLYGSNVQRDLGRCFNILPPLRSGSHGVFLKSNCYMLVH